MLGDKIKKMRKEHKVTQTQLAEAVGLRQSAIGMIERNKNGASPDKLKEIANFFGVTVDYLLSDEEMVIKSNNNNVSKLTTKEKLDIEKEAQKMIDNIDKLDTVEFCGTPADEEDKEYLKLAYEKFLTDVRIYNKQKYTPKKYRDK